MRIIYTFLLVIFLTVSSSGCTDNTEKNKVNSDSTATNSVASAKGNSANTPTSDPIATDTQLDNEKGEVIVKAYYEKPQSLNDTDTILLEGVQQGEEYIEVTVSGEIIDFEQISLIWDENRNELKEKAVVKSLKKVENQTLIIKTILPEGIPSEKIKWKNPAGKTFEYIISDSSLDDSGSNITKFDIK